MTGIETAWARLKAHEIRALAAREAAAVIPVASTEQHGPHLPVMTDARLGEAVAHRAARKAWDRRPALVTPALPFGISEHHMPFGGTLTLSPETFRAVLGDLLDSLRRQGFRDVLISNSHGGNVREMEALADAISPAGEIRLVTVTYVTEAAREIGAILEDQAGVHHACEAETAMMLAEVPDLVDASDLGAIGTAPGRLLGAGRAGHRWRSFAAMTPNGVLGFPGKATADKGERLLEAASDAVAALLADPATFAATEDLRATETGGVPLRE